MAITDLMTLACTIVRRAPSGDVDGYGNDIDGETTTETVCELQQRARPEDTVAGTVAVTDHALFLPAGTDIAVGDAVIVAGNTYEVSGVPWEARNPRTATVSHIEATLVASTGAGGQEAGS